MKRDGSFKSLIEFRREYNLNPKPLEYFGCLSTVKHFARKHLIEIKSNKVYCQPKVFTLLTSVPKGAKPLYNILLGEKEKPNACKKWEDILRKEFDWNKIFKHANHIKESKFKWFQFRICYRVLVTNSILTHMNIAESNVCNFCNIDKDTILHYLWECPFVQTFWNNFLDLLKEKCAHCDRLELNSTLILFGTDHNTKTDICFDDILLKAKFYIYKCRMNKIKPSVQHFVNGDLKQMYKVDKYVHYLEMNIGNFYRKWLLYSNIVN